jgi:hypothetical protein
MKILKFLETKYLVKKMKFNLFLIYLFIRMEEQKIII